MVGIDTEFDAYTDQPQCKIGYLTGVNSIRTKMRGNG